MIDRQTEVCTDPPGLATHSGQQPTPFQTPSAGRASGTGSSCCSTGEQTQSVCKTHQQRAQMPMKAGQREGSESGGHSQGPHARVLGTSCLPATPSDCTALRSQDKEPQVHNHQEQGGWHRISAREAANLSLAEATLEFTRRPPPDQRSASQIPGPGDLTPNLQGSLGASGKNSLSPASRPACYWFIKSRTASRYLHAPHCPHHQPITTSISTAAGDGLCVPPNVPC